MKISVMNLRMVVEYLFHPCFILNENEMNTWKRYMDIQIGSGSNPEEDGENV